MGTRADFYVGRGLTAEWLGSIAWDGYPDGVFDRGVVEQAPDTIAVALVEDEAAWRSAVATFLAQRRANDGTTVADGWPWPWANSQLTDYSYAWDADGHVYATCFGRGWWRLNPAVEETWGEPDGEWQEAEDKVPFPDMTAVQAVTYGERSGLLLVQAQGRDARAAGGPDPIAAAADAARAAAERLAAVDLDRDPRAHLIAQVVYDAAVDHPMWVDDAGEPLDYTPAREALIGEFVELVTRRLVVALDLDRGE